MTSNRVAHAYLFTGARGVGKTSTARILAKCLNCDHGPTPTPCGKCSSCQAIALGEDVDVLEIDGASNNKVEEIRELRQNVQYRPSRSRYKIYIIDEVHMLSTSAFNALLKTLEEPPPHVKFIFATTEVQKIPVTILSRCQRFDLTSIQSKRIQERLRLIVADEQAEADDEALELLARRAGGSMRDAQSLLDQALAFGSKRLTRESVHQLLGTANEDEVAALAKAILAKDVAGALNLLGQAAEGGAQLGELLDQLIDYWRDLMLLKAAGPQCEGLTFPQRFQETLRQQAEGLTLDAIMAGLDILAATKGRLRGTTHGRILMEMALVRLGRLENLVALADIARRLAANGNLTAANSPAVAVKKNSPNLNATSPSKSGAPSTLARPISQPAAPTAATIPLNGENVPEIRRLVLGILPPLLRSHLENAQFVANSAPNCLVFRFPTRYNKDKEYCQSPNSLDRLDEALQKVTGQMIDVRFEARMEAEAPPAEPRVPKAQLLRQSAAQDPLIRKAVEELNAQLVRADDGFGTVAPAPPPEPEPAPESEEPPDNV